MNRPPGPGLRKGRANRSAAAARPWSPSPGPVDLRRERDPAVTEDGHRDTRVNVERGQERTTGTAGVVERNAADAVAGAPHIEGPVDVARFDRVTGTGCEHERVLPAADA